MIFECSCGFTSASATVLYRHLALSKVTDSNDSHSLVQAKAQPKRTYNTRSAARNTVHPEPTPARASTEVEHEHYDDDTGWSEGGAQDWVENYAARPAATSAVAPASTSDSPPSAGRAPSPCILPSPFRSLSPSPTIVEDRSISLAPPVHTISPDWSEEEVDGEQMKWTKTSSVRRRCVVGTSEEELQPVTDQQSLPQTSVDNIAAALPGFMADSAPWVRVGWNLLTTVAAANPFRMLNKSVCRAEEAGLAAMVEQQAPNAPALGLATLTVRQLEVVLTWQTPGASARVFFAGLYLLICVQQLQRGADVIRPISALCAAAFLYLIYNTAMKAYQRSNTQLGAPKPSVTGTSILQNPPKPQLTELLQQQQQEAALFDTVCSLLHACSERCIPYAAALVVLSRRVLSGRRLVTSVLAGLSLWLGIFVGELHLMSEMSTLVLAYVLMFCIPAFYSRTAPTIDAFVHDVLRVTTRAALRGDRATLTVASVAALVLWLWLPLGLVLRFTIGIALALVILVSRQVAPARRAAPTQQVRKLPSSTSRTAEGR